MATYCIAHENAKNGNELRNKTYLNTAILFTSTPHPNMTDPEGAPHRSNVRGRRGRSMVFSWTWNENRKNDMADVRSA